MIITSNKPEKVANPGDVSVIRSTTAPTDIALQSRPSLKVHLVNGHSIFVGVKDMLPEDILWRREHPQVPALICVKEDRACGCPWDCMMKLAMRSAFFFKNFPDAIQLFLMFQRTQESPLERKALRAGDLSPAEQRILGRHNRASGRRTVLPRVWSLHITRDYGIRAFRSNYDALQYLLKDAVPYELQTPIIW